jgi:hypothetical protein
VGVDWINLAQDRDLWRSLLNMAMKLRAGSIKGVGFLYELNDYQLLKKGSAP